MAQQSRHPTSKMYAELQDAYDHFNRDLFEKVLGNSLPGAMITLQRKHATMGYFSGRRWAYRQDGAAAIEPDGAALRLAGPGEPTGDDAIAHADEIALNPEFITVKSIQETMQTLVHEMAHQYQAHFGKPGRGRYHNAELAMIMESIGLILSSTGRPGGKSTGDSMSDYVQPGGQFEKSCKRLLTRKFQISWLDRFPVTRELLAHTLHQQPGETGIALTEEEVSDLDIKFEESKVKKKGMLCYTCPLCTIKVWGKPKLTVACMKCKTQLLTEPV
jgi:predicted SprT family Zn-dependent metalloprotease